MKSQLQAIVFLVKGSFIYLLLLASAAETVRYSIDISYRIDEEIREALNEQTVKTGNYSFEVWD